jgi:hypothetical protein
MTITREILLHAIVSALRNEEYMLAMWLEGSDGTASLDEYSDIDLVCYTQEGRIGDAVSKLDSCISSLGEVDIAYEEPGRSANNRYKVYHLQQSSDHLLVDVTIQSESRPVMFYYEDLSVVPVILFDKSGIVQFQNVESASHKSALRKQFTHAQGVYSQSSRAIKYTKRGLFLESLIYYQKYVLKPLVEVLRIVHTPYQADCFLVHATRDFPREMVIVLEKLYGVATVQDIAEGIQLADEWFRKAAEQARDMLS